MRQAHTTELHAIDPSEKVQTVQEAGIYRSGLDDGMLMRKKVHHVKETSVVLGVQRDYGDLVY